MQQLRTPAARGQMQRSACMRVARPAGLSVRLHGARGAPTSVVCHGAPGLMNLPLARDLEEPLTGFDTIRDALDELAAGKFVVVLDDEDRENEGDLIIAADKVTTEQMAYMVEYTSGVICIAMEGRDLDRLRLPLMVSSAENEEAMYTAFTVTVDLKDGITTGISASDRAKTIRHLADPNAVAGDFRRPGHIFPLRYRAGGVLVRPGHTEAGVDLARLAGSYPAGVLCEIVNKDDGSMARTPQLKEYAAAHGLKCITIADLIRYRLRHEQLVSPAAAPTSVESPRYGRLSVHTYQSSLDGSQHVAFVAGGASDAQQGPVPVYVHRDTCVGDVLGTAGQAGGIDAALQAISRQRRGVVVLMRPRLDGEQPQVSAELSALSSQGEGSSASTSSGHADGSPRHCTQVMDIRVYGLAAQILRDLGVTYVSPLSSDAAQAAALASCGLTVEWAGANGHATTNGHAVAASTNGTHSSLAGVR